VVLTARRLAVLTSRKFLVLTCKRQGLDPALMLPDQQLLIIVF
jgi:hypothetical protein